MKKSKIISLLLIMGMLVFSSVSTYAANIKDEKLTLGTTGNVYISVTKGFPTIWREKQNDSSVYIRNDNTWSNYVVAVIGSDNKNHNLGNSNVIIPSYTNRRIRTLVWESGLRSCQLHIYSGLFASPNVEILLEGVWSPDCAGTYPYAN